MSLSKSLQVVAALVIVVTLMLLAFAQYNNDKVAALRNAGKTRHDIIIFDGIKDFSINKNEVYNTYDAASATYKNLAGSVNQSSGVEYSYNFWMYIDYKALSGQQSSVLGQKDATHDVHTDAGLAVGNRAAGKRHLAPLVLFQRGDPHVYTYKSVCSNGLKKDLIVKNPIVKLENGGDVLSVEFNTLDYPDAHKQCPSANIVSTWSVANQQKVGIQDLSTTNALNAKWFMVTIVVQQTNPSAVLSGRNTSACTIYINGIVKSGPTPIQGLTNNSPVKDATGNLYFNQSLTDSIGGANTYSLGFDDAGVSMNTDINGSPLTRDGKLLMANLTYFNYVLGKADITALYSKGFTNKPAPSITSSTQYTYAGSSSSGATSLPFTDSLSDIGQCSLSGNGCK